MKTKSIIMETGDDFNLNIGDEAYFASMVDMFKSEMPDLRILKFSPNPEKVQKKYKIDSVYQGQSLVKRLISTLRAVKEIKSCDLYSLGGGQMISDPATGLAVILRLMKPYIAIMNGKKVFGYALGVGPLNRGYIKRLVCFVMNKFEVITVRDFYSKKLLEEIGITKQIIVTADAAITLTPPSRQYIRKLLESRQIQIDENKKTIMIAPFGLAYHRVKGMLPMKYQIKFDIWPKGGREEYRAFIKLHAELCDFLLEKYDANIIFVSMDSSSWNGRDNLISKDIIALTSKPERMQLIEGEIDPKDLLGVYSLADLVIGSRMHATILASNVNVPFIGIAFEDKMRGFSERVGLGSCVFDCKDVNSQKLINKVLEVFGDYENLKMVLNLNVTELKKQAYENVLRVKALIGM